MNQIITADTLAAETFDNAEQAVDRLIELYDTAVQFLGREFSRAVTEGKPESRYRAFYPEIRIETKSYAQTDSRLSWGLFDNRYSAPIVRELFAAADRPVD